MPANILEKFLGVKPVHHVDIDPENVCDVLDDDVMLNAFCELRYQVGDSYLTLNHVAKVGMSADDHDMWLEGYDEQNPTTPPDYGFLDEDEPLSVSIDGSEDVRAYLATERKDKSTLDCFDTIYLVYLDTYLPDDLAKQLEDDFYSQLNAKASS